MITPYVFFQGTCAEAMQFYVDVFGGDIVMAMKASDMPDYPVPDDKKDWMAHMTVKFPSGALHGSDDIMGGSAPMAGCSIMMELPTAADGQTAFDQLAEGGQVEMPYEATFWSPGFGTLTDRFGTKWMISTTEQPPNA